MKRTEQSKRKKNSTTHTHILKTIVRLCDQVFQRLPYRVLVKRLERKCLVATEPARARSEALGFLLTQPRPGPPQSSGPSSPRPLLPAPGRAHAPRPAAAASAPEPGTQEPGARAPAAPFGLGARTPLFLYPSSKAKGVEAGENRLNRQTPLAGGCGAGPGLVLHTHLPPPAAPAPAPAAPPPPAPVPGRSAILLRACCSRHLTNSCQLNTATSGANGRPHLAADWATGAGPCAHVTPSPAEWAVRPVTWSGPRLGGPPSAILVVGLVGAVSCSAPGKLIHSLASPAGGRAARHRRYFVWKTIILVSGKSKLSPVF